MTFRRLIFSGGGTKGFTYLGCHKALVELELLDNVESVAGSSIGAVMATLIVLKYTPDELYDFVTTLEYNHLKSIDFWGVLQNLGLDTGEKMHQFFLALIRHKLQTSSNSGVDGNSNLSSEGTEKSNFPDQKNNFSPASEPTFQDLWDYHQIELNIVATHLNQYKSVCFNHQTHPNHSVALTLRKSVAFPWAITPVIENDQDYWVDGGVASNFPIEIYPDSEETLGFLLEDCCLCESEPFQIDRNPESFSYHIVQASCSQLTKWKLKSFSKTKVIHLLVNDIYCLSIDFDEEQKKKLYQYGYQTTKKFLEEN